MKAFMPYAEVRGIRPYYETHGSGDPLVMIMGLGGDSDWWSQRLIGIPSREFMAVVFDNRGLGGAISLTSHTLLRV